MSSSTHSSTSLAYARTPAGDAANVTPSPDQSLLSYPSRSPSVMSSRSGSIPYNNANNPFPPQPQQPNQHPNQQPYYPQQQQQQQQPYLPQRSNTNQSQYSNPNASHYQNSQSAMSMGMGMGMGGMMQRGANSTGPIQSKNGPTIQSIRQQPQRAATTGSGMYSQSNTSMPSLDAGGSGGPPLADDIGSLGFDSMHLGPGTPSFGPQRSKSPSPRGVGGIGAVDRANAMYANQEIHQSAAEVEPQNSLAAIAAEVDQTATELKSETGAISSSAFDDGSNWGGAGEDRRRQVTAPTGGYDPSHEGGGYEDPSTYGAGSSYYGAQGAGSIYPSDDHSHMGAGGSFYPPEDGSGGGGFYGQPYPPGAFAQPGGYQPQAAHQGNGAYLGAGNGYLPQQQAMFDQNGNPYFAAAQGFAGFPEGYSYPAAEIPRAPSVQGHHLGPPSLVRQGTQLSMASSTTSLTNSRRKSKESSQPQQTLPFNKAFVEEYRNRMKGDPDPEAQFAFAKYLIEAAKKVQDPKDGPKQARKYRDTLLSDSLKLVKRLATTGTGLGKPPYSEAQFFLANCFGNGSLGLSVDHEKAYNLYVQASKQNHPAATYRTAVCNEVGAGTRRDHHRAVLFYRKASALGDTAGMYKLGMILLSGLLGQPRNTREAVVWLKRAAGQADEENPHALHELGLLHEKSTNSSIVIHDEAYARELFTQAAQLGYSPSQFKLGSAYEYGSLTCAVDPRRSIAWYTKAAGKGDGESELALSGWYLTGSEGVLKQSDSEAYLWARRAATKGIPKAEYAVGYYSEVGIGVKADLDEAKRWYMRAAAQGNKRAMQRLTELKKMGSKAGKKGARPTRKDAESECVIC